MPNSKKLKDFRPQRMNANRHTERGMAALEASMNEVGYTAPMIAAADGEIIAGSARLETASEVFGHESEPIIIDTDGKRPVIIRRTDIKDAESRIAKRIGLLDNRVQEIDLSFDPNVLAQLRSEDETLLKRLWSDNELAELLSAGELPGEGKDTEPQVGKAEDLREKWGVELGQMWSLGEHKIICGDCTDRAVVERVMGGEKADCVVTDPPYGVDKAEWDSEFPTKWIDLCWSYTDRMLITPGNTYLIEAADKIGKYKDLIALHATNGMTKSVIAFGNFTPVLACGDWKWKPRQNYLGYAVTLDEDIDHPSPKPLKGWSLLIDNYTDAEGVILDPFSGSGTTIIACQNLNRKCRAVEISPGYVAVAIERFFQHTGIQPVLLP